MEWFVPVVVVVGLSAFAQLIVVPAIAETKGRDGGLWFLMTVIWLVLFIGLSVLGVIVAGLGVLLAATENAGKSASTVLVVVGIVAVLVEHLPLIAVLLTGRVAPAPSTRRVRGGRSGTGLTRAREEGRRGPWGGSRRDVTIAAVAAAAVLAGVTLAIWEPWAPGPSVLEAPGLYVTSAPVGATVEVDGNRLGLTPLLIPDLAEDGHEVRVTLDGYEEWLSSDVLARRDERTPLHAALRRAKTSVRFFGGIAGTRVALTPVGAPADARHVTLDAWGQATIQAVETGSYRVVASLAGYRELDRELEVRKGAALLKLDMPPLPALLSIDSDPTGAEVLDGATVLGRTPLDRTEVTGRDAPRALSIRAPEHLPWSRSVVLGRGEPVDLGKVVLRPWGTLDLSEIGPGVTTTIGGKPVTADRLRVPPGGVRVTLTRSGQPAQAHDVRVAPGTTHTLRPRPFGPVSHLDLSALADDVEVIWEGRVLADGAWLPAGDHALTLRRPDHVDVRLSVTVRPGETTAVPAPSWRLSTSGARRNLRATGSGEKTQSAVDLALEWLKNHQSLGGHWDSDGFSDNCKLNKCDGPGEPVYDPGLSGGALLCFLGAGETHNTGQYKDTVKNGLRYLKGIQDSEGCFGPRTAAHFQYNHTIAALAMTEAYGLTGSRLFKDSAQRGVGFVQQSQNPYLAWRYGIRDGDNDTSVTGWAVMVLKSGIMAELDVDTGAFRGAMAWVDKMTEPEFGRVGYQRRGGPPARTTEMQERFPADQSESLTGVGVLTRVFAGQDPRKNEYIQKGADLMLKKPPRWDIDAGTIDFYYWYYATRALFEVGGDHWKKWNESMKTAVVDHQRTEQGRDERGSWDAVDPWAPEGGRVYSTIANCLCLEVQYR